jgi:hypothetical protein
MPLDSMGYQSNLDDWHFYKKADWYYKFAWRPHRCNISKKRIWLKMAYRGVAMYTGPGDPIFEYKWISKEDFMLARIRGTI